MANIKDKEIYPRFEFRLSHEEKDWLTRELKTLKDKFSEKNYPSVSKHTLIVAALRHGIRHLKSQSRMKKAPA